MVVMTTINDDDGDGDDVCPLMELGDGGGGGGGGYTAQINRNKIQMDSMEGNEQCLPIV